jgi:hypothetical protein
VGAKPPPARPADAGEELADFGLGLLLGLAVAFLDQPGELVLVAFGLVKLVIGQLAPEDLGLAFHLLPFAGDLVVVHRRSPLQ